MSAPPGAAGAGGAAGAAARLLAWLEERLGISVLLELGREKRVPRHRHTLWYYLGGMTLFLFGLQVGTGILLLLYYRPSAGEAFESVQFLMTKVPFGWLVRSLHSWSANLLIFVLVLHMFSVFFLRAYRRPRELTWLTGIFLLFLMMAFGFSGYLLPWNTLAFFATQVGTEVAGALPVVGHFALRMLRGGEQVTGGTLTRFYGFHVAVLPALTTVLLLVHLVLVQKHGMSVPPGVEERQRRGAEPPRTMPFVPNFLLRDLIGWCAALGVLAALAAFLPWELGSKADPFAPAPAGIRPEWYFCWMFQTLKILPGHILGVEGEILGILGIGVAGLLWLLVPFLDRAVAPARRRHPAFAIVVWAAIAYMLVMTLWVYLPAGG
ncbi:MAG TPA: cytochrome bc complex cytochrome b subunit [Candidatus Polarisedimenticolia bacterium]|nr:cytochrome bc complex cytochrome b subunit [Candidatus Polarisedimenticolia bacterium]